MKMNLNSLYKNNVQKYPDVISFRNGMKNIENMLFAKSENEKKILIDNLMEMIRLDLQYGLITHVIYPKSEKFKKRIYPFPPIYTDAEDNRITLSDIAYHKNYKTVDFSKDCVSCIPWSNLRLGVIIPHISKNEFIQKHHQAIYFKELEFCYINCGNHSAAAAIIKRQGKLRVPVISVEPMFKTIYTDGEFWISYRSNKQLYEVLDFRFCLLYELAKMKYSLNS